MESWIVAGFLFARVPCWPAWFWFWIFCFDIDKRKEKANEYPPVSQAVVAAIAACPGFVVASLEPPSIRGCVCVEAGQPEIQVDCA